MSEALDVKDRRILSTLSLNARQSLSEIGRKVGLSQEVVNYRLRRLIKKDIIACFRAEIDFSKLGYKTYRLYIRLEGADSEKEAEIFEYLANRKGATWVAACEGKYNLIFRFIVKDEFELNSILGEIYSKFSKYIRERDLTIPIGWQFYPAESGAYEISNRRFKKPVDVGIAKFDERDVEILNVVGENARTSATEIAGKLGMTPNGVKHRVRRLEREGVIAGYQMVADRTKLGIYHYKILFSFQRINEERVGRFIRYCEENPNLVFLVQAIGAWDIDVDLDYANTLEMHNAVLNLSSSFKNLIRNYETLSIFKSSYSNPLKKEKGGS
ncbi:MAG: winged helix-turn-helix transcriptional regulator [Candidatus Micrarchaeota archaeon]